MSSMNDVQASAPGLEGARSYPCPVCGAVADVVNGCAACGQPPDPQAAEVIRLDGLITALRPEIEAAGRTYADLQHRLTTLVAQRNALAARVSARAARPRAVRSQTGVPSEPPSPVVTMLAAAPPAHSATARRAEATPRTVQNVLFVLGGLLLGAAAIVFTAVAFANVGVVGRAVILGVVTLITLAVPHVAIWRELAATAETFAALGLLLLLLDGYAAWYVDIAGLTDHTSPTTYAGLVFGVTAMIGGAYARLTRLAVPRYAALAAAQPVLPLLASARISDQAAWSAVYAVVAALDLLLVALIGRRATAAVPIPTTADHPAAPATYGRTPGIRETAWTLSGLALAVAALLGFGALLADAYDGGPTWDRAWRAGGAIALGAIVLLGNGIVERSRPFRELTSGVATVVLAGAGAYVAAAAFPAAPLVGASAVVMLVAMVVTLLPAGWRTGPRLASFVVTGVAALATATTAYTVAVATAQAAQPWWAATLANTDALPRGWELPVVAALLAAAVAGPLRRARWESATVGAGMVALLLPAAITLPWWAPSIVDVVALSAVSVAVVLATSAWQAAVRSGVWLILATHAVLAGLARPSTTAAVLGAITVTALAVAALGRRAAPRGIEPGPADSTSRAGHRGLVVGAVATALGLVAWPGLAAALAELAAPHTLIASTPTPLAAALAGLVVAVAATAALRGTRITAALRGTRITAALRGTRITAAHRGTRITAAHRGASGEYAVAGAIAVGVGGLGIVGAAVATTGAPIGVLAACVVLCDLAAALIVRNGPIRRGLVLGWAGGLVAAPVIAAVESALPGILLVGAAPYRWLGALWAGAPDGVGLTPDGDDSWPLGARFGAGQAAIALGLLAIASTGIPALLASVSRPRPTLALRWAAPLAVPAILLACVAAGTRWPTVPALSLAIALTAGFTAARVAIGRPPFDLATLALVLGGAGLSGLLADEPSTLIGLGACVAVTAAAGVAGTTAVARTVAWLMSVSAAAVLALAAASAADVGPRWRAYWVLGAAVLALAASQVVRLTAASTPDHRMVESRAIDAAAHATAFLALTLTVGSAAHAAGVATLWGTAIGLRALAPMTTPAGRRWRVVAAAGYELLGYWLLLVAGDVALVEAYSLPLAAVALLAGWLANRGNAALRSWVAYGPALLAAFAPSLATAIIGGAPLRRLAVGVAAVAVVLIGSSFRRQAPVVVGGVVLVMVALNEIARVWDHLPRWLPLAVAGLLLVAVATTYERRLRDMTRLRGAVGRMR
jgi:hypothetical protein